MPTAAWKCIAVAAGPPLGFEVSTEFPLWHGRLEPGASLLAYTDGVTEAFDPGNRPTAANACWRRCAQRQRAGENCLQLIADVHRFAGTAPQSDDITVLAIRRGPGGASANRSREQRAETISKPEPQENCAC